jgi:hypothetical protein
MAEMNKRPAGVSRRSQLEEELIGKITDQAAQMETGRADNHSDPYSARVNSENHIFNIRQGVRMRHPDSVLSQHQGISEGTESAETIWEQVLVFDDTRLDIAEEYKPKGAEMAANQMGLVETALTNFSRSKARLTRSSVVGV